MKLDLSMYSTSSLLEAYELMFTQSMSLQLGGEDFYETSPVAYIYEELVGEIRRIYSRRPDYDLDKLQKIEKDTISRLIPIASLGKSELEALARDMLNKINNRVT